MAPTTPGDAPTPLSELRVAKASFPAPEDFVIRHWLNSAQQLLQQAKQHWAAASQPGGDARKAEDAFRELRKVAEVLQIVIKHSKYQTMRTTRSPEYATYLDIRGELAQAGEMNKEIVKFLERREAAWVSTHGPLSEHNGAARTGAPPARANGGPKGSPLISDDGIDSFIDGYSSQPLAPGPMSRMGHPIAQSSSPPPPKSLAERMAALKSAGMNSSTVRPIRHSLPAQPVPQPTPPQPLSRDATGGSSPRLQAPGSPTVPRKPESLSGRTPPGSPGRRAELAGLVEDQSERSGSAPPAIPNLDRGRTGMLNSGGSNGSNGSNGRQQPASVGLALDLGGGDEEERQHRTADWTRAEQKSIMRSPSEFEGQFPSLDDLERNDFASTSKSWASRHEGPSTFLPSVPSSIPGAPPPARGPLPPPPKPFERPTAEPRRPDPCTGPRSPNRADSLPITAPSRATPAQPAPKAYALPFTTEILPLDLYNYLEMALGDAGRGPRVLMLDVRSREDFDAARISGEVVCLEPIVIRDGRSSYDLESSLSLSPPEELAMFSARHKYDVIVIYDRSSSSIPTNAPPSTASDAQRVLWNLNNAIYEKEFSKSLKRQPILLKGGWEAWEKKIGEKGIVREGVQPTKPPARLLEDTRPRANSDEFSRAEAKKANRKVTVVPGANSPAYTPTSPSIHPASRTGDYFAPGPTYGTNSFSPAGPLMSPRLAMPSPAVHRPGAGQTYDYTLQSSTSNRPSYPQPHLNGLASSTSSVNYSRGLPAPSSQRNDFADLPSQQSYSYSNSPRASIDYPRLRPPTLPSPASRPPPPIPQPIPLTRPPAVQPAPLRSNSSFSGVSVSPYSTPNTNSARFAPQINFGDDAIGLTGLKNLGNTCYMNSTVQCLSATIPFARYFKEGSYKRDINRVNALGTKGALADAVAELIRAIWAQNYLFLSPVTFRENICRWAPQFRGTEQHDAQEFLGFLLDGLHEDLNYIVTKPPPVEMSPEREHDLETLPQQVMSEREWDIYRRRNDSFVVQCFQGQFRNQMKCLTCGKTSTTYNTFMPLSVPIPSGRGLSKVDLQQCIASFVREEILDKEDAWNCPRCKTARKASKKLTLSRLPPILVIHLKRFSFKGPFSDKIETQVQYPLSGLDLTSFMPPPLFDQKAPALKSPPKGHVYDLYGVTNHFGNLSSGHYTAYVRNHNEWNSIGDSKVTQVDPSQVQSARSAYILYFARR